MKIDFILDLKMK